MAGILVGASHDGTGDGGGRGNAHRRAVRVPHERIPLNTLAVAFGLAGGAELWSTLLDALGLSSVVADALWIVAALAWCWLVFAHVARGFRFGLPLADQLRHPAQGPIAALVPVVAMLLGARLEALLPTAGRVVVGIALVSALGFAAWIIRHWIRGGLVVDAVHGGYFLPTVAAGFVGADVAAASGWVDIGWGAFGVAVLFWVVVLTALLSRLALRPPLPAPLVPTLAILAAPPAVGGIAWVELTGSAAGPVVSLLVGGLATMLLVQALLLPTYRRLPFSLGFWSFTFPSAAAGTFLIEWLSGSRGTLWQTWTIVAAALPSALIAGVALRSVLLVVADRRRLYAAERTLERADTQVERDASE